MAVSKRHTNFTQWAKRLIEIVLVLFVFIIFAIPMLLVALCILVTMGRPVFFRQIRTGLHGKPFTIIKFRTMDVARHQDEKDGHRLSRIGQFLRATSLDELPQLMNVLKGELSFVGPRPLLPEYMPLYSAEQARRHEVKPGITGWAQIHGRNALSWPEKFALDVWYVEHKSLRLDCQIVLRTFMVWLKPRGISQPGEATMTKFKGEGGVKSTTNH